MKIPQYGHLPDGYEWPTDSELPVWEPHTPRPHHHLVDFNQALMDLGFSPQAEQDDDLLHEMYSARVGHSHAVFGALQPPQNFRNFAGLVGPVLSVDADDGRSVYADLRDGKRVTGYVSALQFDDELSGQLPFARDLLELSLLIDWESDLPAGTVDYWDLAGGGEEFGGPHLR